MTPTRDGIGNGAIIFLGDDTLTLDLIHAQAFQLNPGLTAISVLETGEHLDVNPAWLTAMEYQRGDVIGKTARDMNIWEHDSFRSEVVRQLTKYGRVENLEGRMRTRTGKLRDIIVSAKRVSYSGRTLAVFASHDITEIKKSHAELEALNRQLEARVTQRTAQLEAKNRQLLDAVKHAEATNDAKSRFLATMSHEIRTPLNAIINMAELLAEETRGGLNANYLSNIVDSAQALAAIVSDTLDFARIEEKSLKIVPVEVDVEAIVEEVIRSLAPLGHRKGIELVLVIAPGLPKNISVDPTRLRQILYNLIGNAIKYTRVGWIGVDVGLARTNGSHELVLSIRDTGIGIASADQNRIFDRFSKISPGSDDSTSGTGLGLNIAQGLVQAMGGAIAVESRPNHGSIFRVTLPTSAFGVPPPAPPMNEVIIVGPGSNTRSALEAVCVGSGVATRVVDEPTAISAPSQHSTALVVLPLSACKTSIEMWYRLACSLCSRVIVLTPIGQSAGTLARLLLGNGQLEFYPIGRSSLFSILNGHPLAAHAARPSQGALSLAGIRVLIADDVEENRLVVEWGLRASGADITTIDNGADAIRLIGQSSFDILLLDLRMPGLDGYETAARIRSLGGRVGMTPIIAVSANVTPDAQKMMASGIDSFLAKPFGPSSLRSAVLETLGRSHTSEDEDGEDDMAQIRHPLLDTAFLSAQLDYAGADAMCKAIDIFNQSLEQRLHSIETTRDDTACIEAIHRLAGAASSLGLSRLFNLCTQLESSFNNDDPGTRANKIVGIRSTGENSRRHLNKYRKDMRR
ncbi:ATP-binding protein [Gluconacetobacter takamatsuzukensis]|uniref:histidine kinase n=1 Tax=Gluconacetobacter takamatsuzukensis TaxID=1286190 RepID=A0A7W4KEA4_9PROT|nr:ATP-binding protein [Gluconacetobacter takamatsuzukensis]MBB2205384.1 response regulator [Gluconacetobacter takamatsuzukensis]